MDWNSQPSTDKQIKKKNQTNQDEGDLNSLFCCDFTRTKVCPFWLIINSVWRDLEGVHCHSAPGPTFFWKSENVSLTNTNIWHWPLFVCTLGWVPLHSTAESRSDRNPFPSTRLSLLSTEIYYSYSSAYFPTGHIVMRSHWKFNAWLSCSTHWSRLSLDRAQSISQDSFAVKRKPFEPKPNAKHVFESRIWFG